jgi:hypothetical protein
LNKYSLITHENHKVYPIPLKPLFEPTFIGMNANLGVKGSNISMSNNDNQPPPKKNRRRANKETKASVY